MQKEEERIRVDHSSNGGSDLFRLITCRHSLQLWKYQYNRQWEMYINYLLWSDRQGSYFYPSATIDQHKSCEMHACSWAIEDRLRHRSHRGIWGTGKNEVRDTENLTPARWLNSPVLSNLTQLCRLFRILPKQRAYISPTQTSQFRPLIQFEVWLDRAFQPIPCRVRDR